MVFEEYEERFIAFIDILGFKNMVMESERNINIQRLIFNVTKYNSDEQTNNYRGDMEDMNSDYGREISVFSDSIVISYPIRYGLHHLLMDCIYLSIDFISADVLVRGGITCGKLFHKKSMCYGPAMVNAYTLESQYAKYPRIIIEDTLMRGIQNSQGNNTPGMEIEELKKLIKVDSDGWIFLDYLSQESEFNEETYLPILNKIRKFVNYQLQANSFNQKILEKYLWLDEYLKSIYNP